MSKVAVVTGASSGIGLATAKALTSRGYKVYGLNRSDASEPDVTFIKTDITDESSVASAINEVIKQDGKIDILINNAGSGISGAVEFTETEDTVKLFNVNFFGAVRVSKAVIPYMREQGSGRIVNISSVAAVTPIPFQTYYSASKSAILSYSMALANELSPFGITVTAVLPGDIRTGFTAARKKSEFGDDIYDGRISRSVSRMEKDEQTGMSPEKAGKYIAKIATGKRKKPIYTIGFGYKIITVIVSFFPKQIVNFILKKIYAN